jgi:signal transduction histidine kinase
MKKLFLILLILVPYTLQAQTSFQCTGSPFIRNYSPEEYDGHPQNWQIIQGKRDLIYVANNETILEFDGDNWRKIQFGSNVNASSLSINPNTGQLFYGAYNSFGYINCSEQGKLFHVNLETKLNEEDRSLGVVRNTHTISNKTYFFTDSKIIQYTNDSLRILPKSTTQNAYKVHKHIIIPSDDGGIFILLNDKSVPLPNCEKFNKKRFGKIIALPFDDNKMLIATEKGGVYIYDFSSLDLTGSDPINPLNEEDNLIKLTTDIDKYLNHHELYSGVNINDTQFAFGTRFGGIVMMDNTGKLLQIINKNNGLLDNCVFDLFKDRDNNLWAALNQGISYIELSSPITQFSKNEGIENVALTSIKHNDIRYVGTYNQGVQYLSNKKIDTIDYKTQFQQYGNYSSYSFALLSVDEILLADYDGTSQLINGKSKVVSAKMSYKLIRSKKYPNYIFMGTIEGLTVLELKENQTYPSIEDKYQFTDKGNIDGIKATVRDIEEDKDGNLWIASQARGIYYLHFNDNISNYEVFHLDTLNGLQDLNTGSIENLNDEIIISTSKGIYKAEISNRHNLSKQDIKFIPIKGNIGAPPISSSSISILTKDENENIWLDTEKGIGYLEKQLNDSYIWIDKPFQKIPGLIADICPENNGNIWFCTSKGLYKYNPEIKKDYSQNYNTLIRKVEIGKDSTIFFGTFYNDSLMNGKYSKLLSLKQSSKLIPVLEYKHNSIRFEYSAIFYEHLESNEYSLIMEGYENEWSIWTKETKKEYTNLREGEYTFKVKAKNIFGHESQVAVYKFSILPPWYRAWWAYSIYLVLAVSFMYVVVKINSKRLKAANLRLENIVEERTSEIAQQNQAIQQQNEEIQTQAEELQTANNHLIEMDQFKEGMTGMIVHDLKNPLSTIIGLSEKAEIQQAGKQMLNMVLNILDVQKFEDAKVKLQVEDFPVTRVINDSIKQVKLLYDRKSIEVKQNINAKANLRADKEIIDRVIVNVLTNAIKYTPNNGSITINADPVEDSGFIKISITDTGEGIPKDKLASVFDRFSQLETKQSGGVASTGLGLTFCKLAVEAHSGEIGVESEEGHGTTFWFLLPKAESPDIEIIEVEDTTIKDVETVKQLTDADIAYLAPFIVSLKEFTVYEFSDIITILHKIDTIDNKQIQHWKTGVENAVRACNEEKYNKLLKQKNDG